MTNDARNEYARLTRRYNKTMTTLDHAMKSLAAKDFEAQANNDHLLALDIFYATRMLDAAAVRVNNAYDDERERLGVRVYRPYGY